MHTIFPTSRVARQKVKKFHKLKKLLQQNLSKIFQLLLNQEQNDPLTAYERQEKKRAVKLCNDVSQKEDRIMNSTAIKSSLSSIFSLH